MMKKKSIIKLISSGIVLTSSILIGVLCNKNVYAYENPISDNSALNASWQQVSFSTSKTQRAVNSSNGVQYYTTTPSASTYTSSGTLTKVYDELDDYGLSSIATFNNFKKYMGMSSTSDSTRIYTAYNASVAYSNGMIEYNDNNAQYYIDFTKANLNSYDTTDVSVNTYYYYTIVYRYTAKATGFIKFNVNGSTYSNINDIDNDMSVPGGCIMGSINMVGSNGEYTKFNRWCLGYKGRGYGNYFITPYSYAYVSEGDAIDFVFLKPYKLSTTSGDVTSYILTSTTNAEINITNYASADLASASDIDNYITNKINQGLEPLEKENADLKSINDALLSDVSSWQNILVGSQSVSSDSLNYISYDDLKNKKYNHMYLQDSDKLIITKDNTNSDYIVQLSNIKLPISAITIKSYNITNGGYIEINCENGDVYSTSDLSADSLSKLNVLTNISYINLYLYDSEFTSDSKLIISIDSENYYYLKGYQDGFNGSDAYNKGYETGYNVGINKQDSSATSKSALALFNAILSYPATFIATAFNFELFGVNLSSVIFFILTISIVGGIIAFILGKRK